MVMLQRRVNWQAGQQIVLTTTAIKDSRDWHRNEVRTIGTNIATPPAGVGAALWLSTPAQYVHEANDGWQGEVALLSRTIVVQGAATDSEPSDTTPLACTDSEWVLSSRQVVLEARDWLHLRIQYYPEGCVAGDRAENLLARVPSGHTRDYRDRASRACLPASTVMTDL